MPAPMAHGSDGGAVTAQEVDNVVWKAGKISASITARSLTAQKWLSGHSGARAFEFGPKSDP